ncbi:hypothetical protein GZ78_15940 [Endozoicomonas numazuensis]|uniref:Uncharacterized protein n=1 Tax=Endozoicomonas numazuensis TaxID=1137799 RepID=A0A081NFT0_9GAMM|nr:hypothetical protein GZ78_15940 [Endozoicomonas numazuensis]
MAAENSRVRGREKADLLRLYKMDKTGGWQKQEKPTPVTLPPEPYTTSYKTSNQGGFLLPMALIFMVSGVMPVSK